MALTVEFKKSQKVVEWEDRFESILDLAEAHDIAIDSECRQGFCGTCKTGLLSGEVAMEVTDGLDNDDLTQKKILPCVAVPTTDIALDA